MQRYRCRRCIREVGSHSRPHRRSRRKGTHHQSLPHGGAQVRRYKRAHRTDTQDVHMHKQVDGSPAPAGDRFLVDDISTSAWGALPFLCHHAEDRAAVAVLLVVARVSRRRALRRCLQFVRKARCIAGKAYAPHPRARRAGRIPSR